ncbi:MAG: hypothetical protein NC133_04125, partial [Prevotella sp.]|nr:hypothetical protein [Prevotella sp.]
LTLFGCIITSVLLLGVAVVTACAVNIKPTRAADGTDAADEIFLIESATQLGTLELGAYPQTYVGNALNETLKNSNLTATGRKFTTNINDTTTELTEYSYNGQKVAKLASAAWTSGTSGVVNKKGRFSDGSEIKNGSTYFFYVEAIQFDLFAVDGNKVVAVAQNALGSQAYGITNDWSQSTLRTYLHDVFAVESGIQSVAQTIQHYTAVSWDDTAGSQVTDQIWLPSINEMRTFYTTNAAAQRPATDFTRATSTDDRGPYGTQISRGAVCSLRGSITNYPNYTCGLDGNTIIYGGENISVKSTCFAFLPAFVLNDATAQYVENVIEPTCTAEGYTESYWQINGEKFAYEQTNVTPMIEHPWGDWTTTTEATCTTDGLSTRTCADCGATATQPIPATGHTYGDWEMTTTVTCTTDGVQQHTCTVCEHTETEIVPAIGHNYTYTFDQSTGLRTYVCANCHDTYFLNCTTGDSHTFVTTQVDATCTEIGYTWYVCDVCKYKRQDDFVDALGHHYQDNTISASCDDIGYTNHICDRCKDQYQDNYLPATGHSYGTWKTIELATTDREGVQQRICDHCGAVQNRTLPALSATGGNSSRDNNTPLIIGIIIGIIAVLSGCGGLAWFIVSINKAKRQPTPKNNTKAKLA